MGIPVSGSKLIPDQLFALQYPDGYRAFALEVDRGTEPVRSPAARKSLARSVAQYREVLPNELHKRHYGLKSGLMVLNVFKSPGRQRQFRDLQRLGDRVLLAQTVSGDVPRVMQVLQLVKRQWRGVEDAAFSLLG